VSYAITQRTTFHPLKMRATKNLPCPICGKKMRRSKTFEATVNPFNRNEDGSVRTPTEVYARLRAEADSWRLIPDTHTDCLLGGCDGMIPVVYGWRRVLVWLGLLLVCLACWGGAVWAVVRP
jgi:hypothetical protein